MLDTLELLALRLGVPPETLLVAGIACGVGLGLWSVYAGFFRRDPVADRMAAIAGARRRSRLDRALLLAPGDTPGRLMKAFVPAEKAAQGSLRRQLAQAGLNGPQALRNYTIARVVLALVLPLAMLGLVLSARTPGLSLPLGLSERLGGMSALGIYQMLTVLVALGYFAPRYWLQNRITERRLRIEESFPNALDLLQISIEAGLGFDAAMTRVGNELLHSAPELAVELLSVQHQVQAGRMRDEAMHDMAERIGLETVRSFANVVRQSIQFGTSMAQALTTYADELRNIREMRAQEMANKLPVKMSMVMASLMLPALITLTVGPVVIRYMQQF